MTALLAATAALAAFSLVTARRRPRLAARVTQYLRPQPELEPDTEAGAHESLGVSRERRELVTRRAGAAAAGAVVGGLVARGDLGLDSTAGSASALVVLGAAAGLLLFNMAVTTTRQRRARRLRFELPVVADGIALHVVAGESVSSAIERFVASASGVASEELGIALKLHQEGKSFTEALTEVSKSSAEPEAIRLYSLLGQAHTTGGRLSASLAELAVDYRAALARDITSEGGRRAIAGYGPVLILMVPVALLFLLYPTLLGLRQLAGGP